ncbi:methyltransferase, FkbM family [Austwickia chelonae]|uniref:Methyltransferase FkbM domain-containing protein n=1 Tax=Austwickia chelonae NBRC 105200 TaxID=1184607 RepID=K6WC76_9MICO|nr:FkbM family methyltransferase [Austwickia chelonae]GAB79452.1 hypothetical protein AUCHE_26_00030 [Austwickia chelonae NBRC 105200]SEV88118.1 methyltransferase, FkbM family [Austwickia chelonae]
MAIDIAGLWADLHPSRTLHVVDIGANPIDGDPPYRPLLDAGVCTVTGFEPQPEALARLQASAGPTETYLPHAVGDGAEHQLYRCLASGMTSLLEPDPQMLDRFHLFPEFGKVLDVDTVHTTRLDDITELGAVDYLKIDVQGSELAVFRGGRTTLARTVMIQTEVSFVPLYRGQPGIGQIDVELRDQGFLPHAMPTLKQWPLAPLVFENNPRTPRHQLLEADLVYTRGIIGAEELDDDQLKFLCVIAAGVYRSPDLAVRAAVELDRRGSLGRPVDVLLTHME